MRWLLVPVFAVSFAGCAGSMEAARAVPAADVVSSAAAPFADGSASNGFEAVSQDPHAVALRRLLREGWAEGQDRDGQVGVPMVDARNWQRTNYWWPESLTGFRYGDEYHAMNIITVRPLPETTTPTAKTCLTELEAWIVEWVPHFGVKMKVTSSRVAPWGDQEVFVRSAEASVNFAFVSDQYSVGWAAYPAYANACLIFGMAVTHNGQVALAQEVRDRWVAEAPARLRPRTTTVPYRH